MIAVYLILTKRPCGNKPLIVWFFRFFPILLFYDCTCNCPILRKWRSGKKAPIVRFLVVLK